ncbi:hypothetical protein DV736_g1015, partial [Chaetothyriales sp. CBS 134916]
MASTTGRTVSLQSLGFRRLSENTHLYTPPANVAVTEANSPGLIIICTWAFAQEKHVAKYLLWYLQIYSSSQILVLQSDTANLTWRPNSWQSSIFEPAVMAVKDYLSSSAGSIDSPPKVLLHLFSNGGGYSGVQLAEFYSARSTSDPAYPTLPIRALVLDSSPGALDGPRSAKALMAGISPKPSAITRFIGPLLTHLIVGMTSLLRTTGLSQSAVDKAWQLLKDPEAPLLKESMSRTYIFSDADEMVDAKDIKLHTQLSIQALEEVGVKNAGEKVRYEEFLGTSHVNHMLGNPERYWEIVKETWTASSPKV